MDGKEKFYLAIELVKKFCPQYKVILKEKSKLHKAIGWCLSKIGNKGYMTGYLTTLGQTTAIPTIPISDSTANNTWQVILHEGRHALDFKKIGLVPFSLCYLFPQVLGILVTLAVAISLACGGSLWSLLGLVSLVLLAPLPAVGRTWLELRGYTVSMAVAFWSKTVGDEKRYIDRFVNIFAGPGYYYMWPFKNWTRKYFEKRLTELKTGQLDLDAYLVLCRTLAQTVSK